MFCTADATRLPSRLISSISCSENASGSLRPTEIRPIVRPPTFEWGSDAGVDAE